MNRFEKRLRDVEDATTPKALVYLDMLPEECEGCADSMFAYDGDKTIARYEAEGHEVADAVMLIPPELTEQEFIDQNNMEIIQL